MTSKNFKLNTDTALSFLESNVNSAIDLMMLHGAITISPSKSRDGYNMYTLNLFQSMKLDELECIKFWNANKTKIATELNRNRTAELTYINDSWKVKFRK